MSPSEDQGKLDYAQEVLQVKFYDTQWLLHALTLVLKTEAGGKRHAEFDRLELRGDAVLRLIVVDDLLQRKAGKLGDYVTDLNLLLGNWRLGIVGLNLGLSKLQMGSIEQRSFKARARWRRSADLVETLIGAMYCDQGLEAASSFIYSRILPGLMRLVYPEATQSLRPELRRRLDHAAPVCRTMSALDLSSGGTVVKVELLHEGERLGTGYGVNKFQAEEEAVRRILRNQFDHQVW